MMPSETEQAFEQILSHEVTFRIHWNNIEARCNVTCLVNGESYRTSALQAKYFMYHRQIC